MSNYPHGRINRWFAFKRSGALGYLVLSAVWIAVSAVIAVRLESWSWISRCGGVLVLFGVLLSLRKLLRLGAHKLDMPIEPIVVNGQFNLTSMYQSIEHLTDNFAQAFGVFLMVAGTVIGSYGDAVLDRLLPFA
ncbi:hypothetical protein [Stenotrophomonas bentonitica]|uniref:hypothetical protein n=1 Tax=Stenotrophomonas bentonitica TaxID=1450134 RepID=UPI00345EC6AB